MKTKIIKNNDLSEEIIAEIVKAIKNNGGYCICAINKTPDTKCMCKFFREEVKEGPCHCGLYKKIIEEN